VYSLRALTCDLMEEFVAKPEFSVELSEAESISAPVPVEVNAAVQSTLHQRPACHHRALQLYLLNPFSHSSKNETLILMVNHKIIRAKMG